MGQRWRHSAIVEAGLQRLARRIAPLVLPDLKQVLIEEVEKQFSPQADSGIVGDAVAKAISAAIDVKLPAEGIGRFSMYVPNEIVAGPGNGEYLSASHPLARDFLHPDYAEFCRLYGYPVLMHRKLWEWAFIFHRLKAAGVLRKGARGLGFGVGVERLPALFANLDVAVIATDAPPEEAGGWREKGDEYTENREQLFVPALIDRARFDALVAFENCNMNAIPTHLEDFDFCWSSCAFEHLGSLQHGIDFVVNSTERTLKIGGVGCHTTEFNLSSDEATVETGDTVIYRKRDLQRLCAVLETRGHRVEALRFQPGDLPPDYLVDVPPYRHNPHLKLQLGAYVTTSVGIVVTRGR